MRVLICGSRTFDDEAVIRDAIDRLYVKHVAELGSTLTIIAGEARGADSIAKKIALEYTESDFSVDYRGFAAEWNKYGRRAGFIRNTQMLVEGKPHLVLAFKDKEKSVGTDMMVDLARKAEVPTYIWSK